MIDISFLKLYSPQRLFLAQGNESAFDGLTSCLKKETEILQTLKVPQLTIEHGKLIAKFATESNGSKRMLVVFFSMFSPESAEILLRSLEESDANTTVIFVTPHPYLIPVTIRSRVLMIDLITEISPLDILTKEQALQYLKKEISKKESDMDAATRRALATVFLDRLEAQCRSSREKSNLIYDAKRMIYKANMPTNFVLEYIIHSVL